MGLLSDKHLAMLHSSAINDDVIAARGYKTIDASEAAEYGFSRKQLLSGLLVPVCGVDGSVKGYQLRPDEPRVNDATGKYIKYETPYKQPNYLDVNPLMQPMVRKARQLNFITEGAKKGDALASIGLTAISITGVWNWRGKNEDDGSTALGDWEDVNVRGSRFIIAFDNDIHTNSMVNLALRRLKQFLLYRKADSVLVLELPYDGAKKIGVDDYLASIQKVKTL